MSHRHKSRGRVKRKSNTKRLRTQDWIDILDQLHDIHPAIHDQPIVDHATMIVTHVTTKPHIHKKVLSIFKPYGGIPNVFKQAMKMTTSKYSGVGDIISFPFLWFGKNYTFSTFTRNKSLLYFPFGLASYAVGLALYLAGVALFSWNIDLFGAFLARKTGEGVEYVATKIGDAETAVGSTITSGVQSLDQYTYGIPSKIQGGVVMTAGLAGSLAQQAIVKTPDVIIGTANAIGKIPEYVSSLTTSVSDTINKYKQ
jgi:hypothetical protein